MITEIKAIQEAQITNGRSNGPISSTEQKGWIEWGQRMVRLQQMYHALGEYCEKEKVLFGLLANRWTDIGKGVVLGWLAHLYESKGETAKAVCFAREAELAGLSTKRELWAIPESFTNCRTKIVNAWKAQNHDELQRQVGVMERKVESLAGTEWKVLQEDEREKLRVLLNVLEQTPPS